MGSAARWDILAKAALRSAPALDSANGQVVPKSIKTEGILQAGSLMLTSRVRDTRGSCRSATAETLSFDAIVTPGYGFDVVELSDELAHLVRGCYGGALRKQPPESVRVLIGEQLVVGGLVSHPVPRILSRCPDQVLARVVCVGRALLARWTIATGVAAVKV